MIKCEKFKSCFASRGPPIAIMANLTFEHGRHYGTLTFQKFQISLNYGTRWHLNPLPLHIMATWQLRQNSHLQLRWQSRRRQTLHIRFLMVLVLLASRTAVEDGCRTAKHGSKNPEMPKQKMIQPNRRSHSTTTRKGCKQQQQQQRVRARWRAVFD